MNFEKDVIEKSMENPVLVDFWAPWCGPCRVLGPVLEEVAADQSDRWTLLKINTEEFPEIASQYNVRSIPNIKLFHKKQVIAEFNGALPKQSLLRWLDEHIPREEDIAYQSMLQNMVDLSEEDRANELNAFLLKYPGHTPSKLELARMLVFKAPDKASNILGSIENKGTHFDSVSDLNELLRLQALVTEDNPANQTMLEGVEALKVSDYETAIQKLIKALTIDKHYKDDLARKSTIALFRILGNKHPLSSKYRKLFDMAVW